MVQLSILRISASAEKQVALRGKNSLYLSTDGRCTCTVSAATFSSLFALVRVVLAGSALEKARWLAIWSPIERSIEVSLCVSRGGVQLVAGDGARNFDLRTYVVKYLYNDEIRMLRFLPY